MAATQQSSSTAARAPVPVRQYVHYVSTSLRSASRAGAGGVGEPMPPAVSLVWGIKQVGQFVLLRHAGLGVRAGGVKSQLRVIGTPRASTRAVFAPGLVSR